MLLFGIFYLCILAFKGTLLKLLRITICKHIIKNRSIKFDKTVHINQYSDIIF